MEFEAEEKRKKEEEDMKNKNYLPHVVKDGAMQLDSSLL